MTESASVEVLTAEVRVLQVGNRQITRSIYRQLDAATFERFEPFGRVRNNERADQVTVGIAAWLEVPRMAIDQDRQPSPNLGAARW